MKLKSLVVITLIVLGCSSAFAGSFSFGFLNYTGALQYCNCEVFTTFGPDTFYLEGMDVLSACPGSANPFSTIEGFAITVPAAAVGSAGFLQKGITGKAFVYADNIYDAYYGSYTGAQSTVITKTVAGPIKANKWDWDLMLGFSGSEMLQGYGFLTSCNIPRTKTVGTIINGSLKKANNGSPKSTAQ